MRVFAAIFPPEEAVDDLARMVEPFERSDPALRWTTPMLWHLTLAFFGNITHDDQVRLNRAVAGLVSGRRPLRVRIAAAGAFPEPSAATTLWAGVESPDDALADLSRELIGSVLHFGWMLDRRSFRAHLTLARSPKPSDLSRAVAQLSSYAGPEWTVPSIAVVWSRQGEDGEPFYKLLGEHPFPA